jgi:regulator of protease activity HflC (stomatin/prohibitin superfamily)
MKDSWLSFMISGFVIVIILGIAFLLLNPFVIVDQTDVAVIKTFGVFSHVASPGLSMIIPLVQSTEKYYVGIDTIDFQSGSDLSDYATLGYSGGHSYEPISSLTSDGLEVVLDISIQTQLKVEAMDVVPLRFFSFYELEQWKIAAIRGGMRQVLATYRGDALYGELRGQVETELVEKLESELSEYFTVVGVHIRHVSLPVNIKSAIEQKLQSEQEAQKMQFVVQREKLEADRKELEARGIAQYNSIISNSLDDKYLQWYYIQNLQALSVSPNAKTILLPSSQTQTQVMVATN